MSTPAELQNLSLRLQQRVGTGRRSSSSASGCCRHERDAAAAAANCCYSPLLIPAARAVSRTRRAELPVIPLQLIGKARFQATIRELSSHFSPRGWAGAGIQLFYPGNKRGAEVGNSPRTRADTSGCGASAGLHGEAASSGGPASSAAAAAAGTRTSDPSRLRG